MSKWVMVEPASYGSVYPFMEPVESKLLKERRVEPRIDLTFLQDNDPK